jgi:hypothetical protein
MKARCTRLRGKSNGRGCSEPWACPTHPKPVTCRGCWESSSNHTPAPENVAAGPVDEHFSNAGLNLLEVPGDHLPEPVGGVVVRY